MGELDLSFLMFRFVFQKNEWNGMDEIRFFLPYLSPLLVVVIVVDGAGASYI